MKNKKKRKREYLGVFFLIILILVLSLLAMFVMRNNHIEKNKVGKYFNTLEIQENTNKIDIAEISSKYIALYELDSWNEIYKENSSKKMYPASLTKMITAIILIEEPNKSPMYSAAISNVLRTTNSEYDVFRLKRILSISVSSR